MKRRYFLSAVCSVLATAVLFSIGAYGSTDKVASKPQGEATLEGNTWMQLTGKVVEAMDVENYTYICIEKDGEKTWVAVDSTPVTPGQKISFGPAFEVKNFRSKKLNRTFKSIYFSNGVLAGPETVTQKNGLAKQEDRTKAAVPAGEKIRVEKASGKNAYTVAELYAKSAALNKKTAIIRGEVVKVVTEIMGKNWIHLQDGTGNAATRNNEIVVTSQESPKVGDIITVRGTVYKDKDFGSGYKYHVIMELATILR